MQEGGSAADPATTELVIAEAFPDAGVAAAVAEQVDADGSGTLSVAEIESATTLNVENASAVSGLGQLPQLDSLTVTGATASVEVSDVPGLTTLDVAGTAVAKLDLSHNSQLASLNVNDCAHLQVVQLNDNQALKEADFSSCKQLKGVDVTGCTNLASVNAQDAVVFNGLDDTQVQERWLVTEFSWHRPAYEAIGPMDCEGTAEYDKQGRLTKLVTDGFGDAKDATWTYSYGDNGLMNAASVYWRPDIDTVELGIEYNDQQQVDRVVYAQRVDEADEYAYDSEGRLVKGPYKSYSYDEQGQVTAIKGGERDGSLTYKDGLLTKASGDDAFMGLVTSYAIATDAAGNVTSFSGDFATAGSMKQTLSYNEQGALTNVRRDREAGNRGTQLACPVVDKTSFKYDDHGNLVSWTPVFTEDGTTKGKGKISYTRIFLPKDSTQPRQDFLFVADPLNPQVELAVFAPDSALHVDYLMFTNGYPDTSRWIPRAQPAKVADMAVEEAASAPSAEGEESAKDEGATDAAASAAADDYVLPESDTRKYSKAELEELSDRELFLARNEVFARHGRQFNSEELQEYFGSKDWYDGTIAPEEFDALQEDELNAAEKANVKAMLAIEQARGSEYLS
ncbi:YARHG domain-containing protein [uncultured Adlercreutzia sp.]|uniref:YARHG domain-containing protein n=1 Tax=uncultured Adlercreutzia sp. TaxID=875803 RepID=UPI002609CE7D|nr:YARHG domain-containing protein [uncultured Adlercreutzia sp.]MCI9261704.1 YARHG domain-containing protein [Eggerthellaceae bacterium]